MSVKSPNLKQAARKAAATTKGTLAQIPGPSNNPATNLLIMDIAMRGVSLVAGRVIEKALLRSRYHPSRAADIVQGRSMLKSLAATAAARVASRSLPGFVLVTGGLLAKAVFDRSFSRRESVRRGEQELAEQAAKAEE